MGDLYEVNVSLGLGSNGNIMVVYAHKGLFSALQPNALTFSSPAADAKRAFNVLQVYSVLSLNGVFVCVSFTRLRGNSGV